VLAPPVARIGCAIITAYVPGESLLEYLRRTRGRDERRWVRATGRLLAHLHAGCAPGGRAETAASHRRFFRAAIRRLERRGRVRREIAAQLRRIAAGGPRRARRAVTHGDLHPSNLIVTAGGRLCAIDEERLAVRPAAFDIARVVARWPLDAEMEEELLFAYRRSGGRAESYVRHRRFWIGVALAVSAHYRTFFGLPGAAESVARLRRFASSGGTRGGGR